MELTQERREWWCSEDGGVVAWLIPCKGRKVECVHFQYGGGRNGGGSFPAFSSSCISFLSEIGSQVVSREWACRKQRRQSPWRVEEWMDQHCVACVLAGSDSCEHVYLLSNKVSRQTYALGPIFASFTDEELKAQSSQETCPKSP